MTKYRRFNCHAGSMTELNLNMTKMTKLPNLQKRGTKMYIYCKNGNTKNINSLEEPALFDTSNAVSVKLNFNIQERTKRIEWQIKLITVSGTELIVYRSYDGDEIKALFHAVICSMMKKESFFDIDMFIEEKAKTGGTQ